MSYVPVLEVGGTHVAAALVDPVGGVVGERLREPLDSAGSREAVVGRLAEVARRLPLPEPARWAVAMPGPFDYERGIGDFRGADKFHALEDVDLGAALAERVDTMTGCGFLNDAAAFGLGEAQFGAGGGADRVLFVTLGTGLGSAFVDHGRVVESGDRVPPHGWLFLASLDGQPLEDAFSRRALIERYRARTGRLVDVGEIAAAVPSEPDARAVFSDAYRDLARGLAPWLDSFAPEALVLGGSIARSWGLIDEFFVPLLRESHPEIVVRGAELGDDAPMLGAAHWLSA